MYETISFKSLSGFYGEIMNTSHTKNCPNNENPIKIPRESIYELVKRRVKATKHNPRVDNECVSIPRSSRYKRTKHNPMFQQSG